MIAFREQREVRLAQAEPKRVEPFDHHAAVIQVHEVGALQILRLCRITDPSDVVGRRIKNCIRITNFFGN